MWIVLKPTAKRFHLRLLTRSAAVTEHMLFVITVNITSNESLIVYYCKYIWSLWRAHRTTTEINVLSCLFPSNRLYLGSSTASSLLLLSVSEAPVKSEINKCKVWTPMIAKPSAGSSDKEQHRCSDLAVNPRWGQVSAPLGNYPHLLPAMCASQSGLAFPWCSALSFFFHE